MLILQFVRFIIRFELHFNFRHENMERDEDLEISLRDLQDSDSEYGIEEGGDRFLAYYNG